MKTSSIKRIVLAGIFILLSGLSILYWPVKLEGFWSSPIRPMGPGIAFYLFKDGKILHYIESGKYVSWVATYEKIGWNKYKTDYPSQDPTNSIVRTGLFRSKSIVFGDESRRIRDIARYIHVYNNNHIQWLTPIWEQAILVTNQNSDKDLFWNGIQIDLKRLGERISDDRIKLENSSKPLQIYSSTNYVPIPILDSIKSNGFEYVIHTNQGWIINLDDLYLQVSRNENSQYKYSIKRIRDDQLDIRLVDLKRIIMEFEGTQEDTRLRSYRSQAIDIVTHSSFDISQLLAAMDRLNQRYNVITNDLWIEKTDSRCWSLLYCNGSFLDYCHFNGHGCFPVGAKYDVASFRRYREKISRPIVVYAPERHVPEELVRLLEANHISYTVKSNEILLKKDYVIGRGRGVENEPGT
jgi:hypothetical protein